MSAPVSEEVFDWTHPSMRVDPHPTLHRFRERGPIHRNDMGWWVLSYAEAERVIHGSEFSRRRERFLESFRLTLGEGPAYEYVTRRLTYYGPPDHKRLRGTISRAFTPRRIEAMRPYITQLATELLDRMAGESEFDILAHVAHPLPSLVICQMLGVPEELRANFDEWTGRIPHLIAPKVSPEQLESGTRAVIEEWECIEGLIEERRRRPGDDLLTALINAEEDGERLTREELVANVIFLFSAGHQTTRDSLAMSLLGLLGDGRLEYEDLVAHPQLAAQAVEETLRWGSVVAMAVEHPQVAVTIGEAEIGPGENVWVVIPAVNRDPERFADPDRFWIRRPSNVHMGFSGGPHFCLGAALGRLELTVLLQILATRYPQMELGGGDLEWRDTLYFRGPRTLPVVPGRRR